MTWDTEASDIYRQLAAIAVPQRAQQLATLLTLIPFGPDEPFTVVELASGEGRLSQAILSAFPKANVLALDFEPTMREETAKRVQPFNNRGSVDHFDILAADWFHHLDGADVVISSLCVHHLDGNGKQRLFKAIQQRLSDRGALLIADIVAPKRSQSNHLFAATWDREAQSADDAGKAYDLFVKEKWNIFIHPDDFDKPSPLSDQLAWLTAAGFHDVDCFWMLAGHAIFGGYGPHAGDSGIAYTDTLPHVTRALGA